MTNLWRPYYFAKGNKLSKGHGRKTNIPTRDAICGRISIDAFMEVYNREMGKAMHGNYRSVLRICEMMRILTGYQSTGTKKPWNGNAQWAKVRRLPRAAEDSLTCSDL